MNRQNERASITCGANATGLIERVTDGDLWLCHFLLSFPLPVEIPGSVPQSVTVFHRDTFQARGEGVAKEAIAATARHHGINSLVSDNWRDCSEVSDEEWKGMFHGCYVEPERLIPDEFTSA